MQLHLGVTLTELSVETRLDDLPVKTCRPLVDAKGAIAFALERFHESWHAYKTITPTLYGIREEGRGVYLTLGNLRRSYGLTPATLDSLTEAFEHHYGIDGYLLASKAVGGDPLRLLFGLQGHTFGEKHYGALDLITFQPFEDFFQTEFDVSKELWEDLQLEAATNSGLAKAP